MMQRLKSWRSLRLAVALFLAPVVVFATPTTALAAAPWHEVTTTHSGLIPGDSSTCWLPLQQHASGAALNIGAGAYCVTTNPDTTPGYSQYFEAGAGYTIEASGIKSDGSVCGGATAGTFGDHPSNGTIRVAGSIAPGTGDNGVLLGIGVDEGGCTVTEVCVISDIEGPGAAERACGSANIAAVEDTEYSCAYGSAQLGGTYYEWGPGDQSHQRARLLKSSAAVTTITAVPSNARWVHYVVIRDGFGQNVTVYDGASTRPTPPNYLRHHRDTPAVNGVSSSIVLQTGVTAGNVPLADIGKPEHNTSMIIGAGVFYSNNDFYNGRLSADYSVGGYLGWTSDINCSFYWGEPIRRLDPADPNGHIPLGDVPLPPDQTTDEPPLPPEEPPIDVGEDFNWLAAIWGVLKAMLGAIGGLAGAIASAIGSALRGLFIPDSASWGVGGLVNQLETKPPFSLLAELEDEARSMGAAYSSGGSCGTLADFGNGNVLDCSKISGVPGYSALYTLVSAGLMGLTGWSMFLMVSRTFESGQ